MGDGGVGIGGGVSQKSFFDTYGNPYSAGGQEPYILNYDFYQVINGVRYVSYQANPQQGHTSPAPPTAQSRAPAHTVVGPSSVNRSAPIPPHLQFNFNTIGRAIPAVIGRHRAAGNIIWARGISASGQLGAVSSLCTFAASYGSPIDPTEDVSIARLWANGTLLYDVTLGGLQYPSLLDPYAMALLQNALDLKTVYTGTEAQAADPIIIDDKGVAATPAFRGQRYIVWTLFPLGVSGNSVPNINIEWVRVDGERLRVADIFVKLGAKSGLTVVCENIDDMCDGCVIAGDKSFRQFCDQHRGPYNYQIIDRPDGSILLVRRRLQVLGASF